AGMGLDVMKCGMCGRQYTSEELALLPGFQPSLDESSPFCPRCGGYLFSDETECAICGTAVTTAKPTIPTANAKGVVKDFLTRWPSLRAGNSRPPPPRPRPSTRVSSRRSATMTPCFARTLP